MNDERTKRAPRLLDSAPQPRSNFTLRRRVQASVAAAVLLSGSLGWLSRRVAHQAAVDADWVAHTREVSTTLEGTLGKLLEVQNSARGFSLTGEDRFLEFYGRDQSAATTGLARLRLLVGDNPRQLQRLDQLERLAEQRLKGSADVVALRRSTHAPAPAPLIERGEQGMDAVRGTVLAMEAEETSLLGQRTQRTANARRGMNSALSVGSVLDILFLILAGIVIDREMEAAAQAEARLNAFNAGLEASVAQRTAALEAEQAALRESEERFQAMANGMPQLAWMAEPDGSIFWYNQRWYEYTGTTFADMQGWGWQRVHHPDSLLAVMERWKSAIAAGTSFDMEFPLRAKDGTFRTFLTRIDLLKDADGQVVRWFGTNTDISERKRTEELLAAQAAELAHSRLALQEQQLMLQSVLNSMQEGLIAADASGNFIIWNDAAVRLVGMDPAKLIPAEWSRHYGAYLPDEVTSLPLDQNPLFRAIRGEISSAEIYLCNPGLEHGVLVESNGSPLRDSSGTLRGGVIAIRDITRRKTAELEIHKLNEDLEQRINLRTAQLQAANDELQTFTYSVSHDLRAPLRHIGGFSRILLNDFSSALLPEAQSYLQRIGDAVTRMGLLVDGLLSLAKLGRQGLKVKPHAMDTIVEQVVAMLQSECEGRLVEWQIAQLPWLDCDQTLMVQVFQNLLGNALKYTRGRHKAVIEVSSLQAEGQAVTVFVRDNGCGFNMQYAGKLFEVFQRMHAESEFEGTGVGLATVQRIIQKHGEVSGRKRNRIVAQPSTSRWGPYREQKKCRRRAASERWHCRMNKAKPAPRSSTHRCSRFQTLKTHQVPMSAVTHNSAQQKDRQTNHPQDWLAGGGRMGELILSMDWSGSPLGPIEFWPQSLCTTVSLCLASSFPISVAWGPEHVQIYNDGYWPICGEKHPLAMGQTFTECWASAWPVIGEAFARACAGETSFLENQRMFLDRNGYLEETFFTFSFSPIRDEHGVAGLFHPVTETTARMLGERRTRALSDLAARTGKSRTVEEACALAVETLEDYRLDVPFILLYLFDGQSVARLMASSGLAHESPAHAVEIDLGGSAGYTWPLSALHSSGSTQHATNLEACFGHLACNDYSESVKEALVLPILPPGCQSPIGAVIAGVSSRLPLNEPYRAFYDLLAAAVTREVANARAHEEESRRAEALAELDRAKTHFFANVSHEFRTPLTLMLGPLEEEMAERKDPLPPLRYERLATAHRNSLRLLKLVNHLLDFSRIEAGRIQASYEPIDLAAYTVELASVFRSAMEKAELTLHLKCPPLAEPALVDRDMWEKIVLNLLSNALKHTFTGGITVGLKEYGEDIELSVADTGVGIAAGELPHLFERFRRVRDARSRTHEGTGIGLALVRELAQLHGGSVAVASQEGVGSTFTVTIKRGTTHLPQERLASGSGLVEPSRQKASYVEEGLSWIDNREHMEEAAAAAPGAATSVARIRPKILLADDNADMRAYVARLLSDQYDVAAVGDGLQALARAQAVTPDLVLTDIMMPGLDGFGLLRALRAQSGTRGVPVIFLSARAGQEQAVEGLNAGADDYLAKPFSAEELLARVHTHLEQSRIRRIWASELEQSNKELETFSYSVSHDLRAPLRALDGFSKLLLEEYAGLLDEQGRRYLERIRMGTQNMSAIINSLLTLSRVNRGVLRKQAVNLSDLAERIFAGLKQREPLRSVMVTLEDGLIAEADRRLITIALRNLLENAWQYTARQSLAEITFGREDQAGEQVFFIRDNGSGFDSQYADQLFKPLQNMRRAEEFSGGGIGLAMVHRVIARHGGRIWAQAAKGTGATFYFTLGGLE